MKPADIGFAARRRRASKHTPPTQTEDFRSATKILADLAEVSDEYEPDFEEAQELVRLLLAANQRLRVRGKKGSLIRQLKSIDRGLALWPERTPEEKRRIVAHLWSLNSGDGAAHHYEILGAGRFDWRGDWRPRGLTADKSPSDEQMIAEALERRVGRSLGAALRFVIKERARGAYDIESVIKRLRRRVRASGGKTP